MNNFTEFGLSSTMLSSLAKLNFTSPTEIQAKTLPPALEGKSILGISQTGTGKTLAFGMPLIEHLLRSPNSVGLIITPTRELAKQVEEALLSLVGKDSPIRSALLVGGDSIIRQLRRLEKKNQIIVGTPGRINDHLQRRSLSLKDVDYVVLDEADRMLDIGFSVQIEEILKSVKKERQMLLFSATMPGSVLRLAQTYLNDAVRVEVKSDQVVSLKIHQEKIYISEAAKQADLIRQLSTREGSVLVFVKTKRKADKLASSLTKESHEATAIHGDIRQNKRERIMRSFRNNRFRVLIATDLAARGLDVPHIEHVINYDLPTSPEDYVHRVGRTGRAGRTGSALCYISPADERLWRMIEEVLDPSKKRSHSGPSGKKPFKGDRNRSARFSKSDGNFSRGKPRFGQKEEGASPFRKRSPRSEGAGSQSAFSDNGSAHRKKRAASGDEKPAWRERKPSENGESRTARKPGDKPSWKGKAPYENKDRRASQGSSDKPSWQGRKPSDASAKKSGPRGLSTLNGVKKGFKKPAGGFPKKGAGASSPSRRGDYGARG